MRKREIVQYLKDNGYWLEGMGRHAIYTNGTQRITVHMGDKIKSYAFKAIKVQVRNGTGIKRRAV